MTHVSAIRLEFVLVGVEFGLKSFNLWINCSILCFMSISKFAISLLGRLIVRVWELSVGIFSYFKLVYLYLTCLVGYEFCESSFNRVQLELMWNRLKSNSNKRPNPVEAEAEQLWTCFTHILVLLGNKRDHHLLLLKDEEMALIRD